VSAIVLNLLSAGLGAVIVAVMVSVMDHRRDSRITKSVKAAIGYDAREVTALGVAQTRILGNRAILPVSPLSMLRTHLRVFDHATQLDEETMHKRYRACMDAIARGANSVLAGDRGRSSARRDTRPQG
jgi:hypothetical protein